MVTSEERLTILKMVEEGKISVEDAANLLAALQDRQSPRRPLRRQSGSPRDSRMLRVKVDDGRGGKRKVNVVLPMALLDAGLNIASSYIDENTETHVAALLDAVRSGETGKVLDYLDEGDGEHVQVFIE